MSNDQPFRRSVREYGRKKRKAAESRRRNAIKQDTVEQISGQLTRADLSQYESRDLTAEDFDPETVLKRMFPFQDQ